jgi:hypothetical protein
MRIAIVAKLAAVPTKAAAAPRWTHVEVRPGLAIDRSENSAIAPRNISQTEWKW